MNDSTEIQEVLAKAEFNCYNQSPPIINGIELCELFFDGIMCWPPTTAGSLANQSCSNNYIKSLKKGFATKKCDDNGHWYIPPHFNKSWTNYTECGNFFIEKNSTDVTTIANHTIYNQWLPMIKNITQFGYVLSTLTLIASLIIFIKIKRLHCARNKLHVHLFISFVMRALMSLIKDGLFVNGTAFSHDAVYVNGKAIFMEENYYSWLCKGLTSLRNYFIISNYMFILMEGTYLHNLMFLNLFSENGVTLYYTLGWTVPTFFIIPWIILKVSGEDEYCWTQKANKYIALLLDLPIGLSVFINSLLFARIMRILFVKLTSMYIQQRRVKYQKLLRSTLILVPLFGVPYTISFILSFYVTRNQTLELLWLFFDQTFTAFQGLFASLVYCLLNTEVQMELRRKYNSFKDRNNKEFKRSRTISHTQQIPLNEEMQDLPQDLGHNLKKTSDFF